MQYNEWLTAYTKLTNKLNKKKPLTTEEIDELLDIIEKTRNFINQSEYETFNISIGSSVDTFGLQPVFVRQV